MPEYFEFNDGVYVDGETTIKPDADIRMRLQGVKYERSGIVSVCIEGASSCNIVWEICQVFSGLLVDEASRVWLSQLHVTHTICLLIRLICLCVSVCLPDCRGYNQWRLSRPSRRIRDHGLSRPSIKDLILRVLRRNRLLSVYKMRFRILCMRSCFICWLERRLRVLLATFSPQHLAWTSIFVCTEMNFHSNETVIRCSVYFHSCLRHTQCRIATKPWSWTCQL